MILGLSRELIEFQRCLSRRLAMVSVQRFDAFGENGTMVFISVSYVITISVMICDQLGRDVCSLATVIITVNM